MNQEELKTCLGQLLSDLRGNWAYEYYDRLIKAEELCNLIEEDTSVIESKIEYQKEGDYEGRTFKNVSFYNYFSEDGSTAKVKEWLQNNLTHPEYCDVLG